MKYPYTLPELNYLFDSLEPSIDTLTMEIHYTKHHQAYIDTLNKALESHSELHEKSLSEILSDLSLLPVDIQTALRNNGGGHLNHTFFWSILTPDEKPISENFKKEIEKSFGTFDQFKEKFTEAALNRFGSGWAWLVKNDKNELEILSTPNQDNPIADKKTALLGLDVWEHAYYLKYQNKRAEYVNNFWKIVNW